jgi:hypothetical protein
VTRSRKLSPQALKKLQDTWEKRLASEGMPRNLPSGNPYRSGTVSHDVTTWNAKAEYFRQLSAKVQEAKFLTPADKIIMNLRATGCSTVGIHAALEAVGMKTHKYTIRLIVRRYENDWGIRKWTAKQRGQVR